MGSTLSIIPVEHFQRWLGKRTRRIVKENGTFQMAAWRHRGLRDSHVPACLRVILHGNVWNPLLMSDPSFLVL